MITPKEILNNLHFVDKVTEETKTGKQFTNYTFNHIEAENHHFHRVRGQILENQDGKWTANFQIQISDETPFLHAIDIKANNIKPDGHMTKMIMQTQKDRKKSGTLSNDECDWFKPRCKELVKELKELGATGLNTNFATCRHKNRIEKLPNMFCIFAEGYLILVMKNKILINIQLKKVFKKTKYGAVIAEGIYEYVQDDSLIDIDEEDMIDDL